MPYDEEEVEEEGEAFRPVASPSAAVRRSPTSPLVEVRNSEVHGRGVFAVAPIKKGTRIFEYLGDRVSHDAADKRYEDHDENDNHTFLFIVDKNTVIDAAVDGNDARFINHHCDGNCESVIENRRVFIDAAARHQARRRTGLRLRDRPRQGRSAERRRDLRLPLRFAEVPRLHARGLPKKKAKQAGEPNGASKTQGSQEPPSAGEASRRTVTPARLIDQLAERGFGVARRFRRRGAARRPACALPRAARHRRRCARRASARGEHAEARARSARRFHLVAVDSPSAMPSNGCSRGSRSCAPRSIARS